MVLRRLFGRNDDVEPTVGGLYSVVKNRQGTLGVIKVLALDDRAVHVRSYANSFDTRPDAVDPSSLTLGSGTPLVRHPDGSVTLPRPPQGPIGIGHLPISHATFRAWRPELMAVQPVVDDELDGYREWQAAGGGVFG
jgi:hypothetical protein